MLFGFTQIYFLNIDKETFLILTKRLFRNSLREHIRRAESNHYFASSRSPLQS